MKPKKYVVSFSGGKDSTAMLLRLIEEGYPIDYIVFCDTGLEFSQMYEHIKKVEEYIGRPIITLRSEYTFEYLFFEYHPKRRNPELEKYNGMSWGSLKNRWCTAMLKTRVVDDYFKELSRQYEIIEYVGIAADEQKRIKNKCYPLVKWNMTERDCLEYCYERGFDWGGLYRIFNRVSCWCCPLQSLDELRKLKEYFPDLWVRLKYLDENTWRKFRPDYSVKELSIRFDLEKEYIRQGKSIRSKEFFADFRRRCD